MKTQEWTLHQASCDVWDMPRSDAVESFHPETGRDPATDLYLARIAPAYERLARVLAQLCGVFLLALTRDGKGTVIHLDHAIYTIALDQLGESREIIGGAVAPEAAQRHRTGLVDLADHLAAAAAGMDRMSGRRTGVDFDTDKRDVLKCLAVAQRLLIATAEPDAGITPVDFDHACCNCAITLAIT